MAESYEWVMLIDDDTYIAMESLQRELAALGNADSTDVYRGMTTQSSAFNRDPCLNLDVREYPSQRKPFTPVVGGSGILLSRSTIRKYGICFTWI